ncbi:MAG: nucleotidyltransferase domain-containing protein [Candidatus Micrarchaeota archaeon]|nr:nucleotidyltransferase domain-containing protein [Candidatus Micrarchaeota archaeon]
MVEGFEFLESLKRELRPDNRESLRIAEMIREKLGLDLRLYGSVAKGTNLRSDYDLDMFYETDGDKHRGFNEILEAVKRSKLEYTLRYSEHPYVRVKYGSIDIDIVPISKHYRSAVDRTPLHYEYIMSRVNDTMRDEIRLLKKFLKTLGLYGADNKVNGFSGYLCELLIIHYGSFLELIRDAKSWRIPVRIDIEGVVQREFSEDLVVVDPTDGTRNVAAAVSRDNLSRFIMYSRGLWNRRVDEYFKISRISRGGEFGILLSHNYDLEDKAYGILRKIGRSWREYLERKRIYIEYLHVFVRDNLAYLGGIPLSSQVNYQELEPGPPVYSMEGLRRGFLREDRFWIPRQYVHDINNLTLEFISKTDMRDFRVERIGYDIEEFREMREVEYWREDLLLRI